VAEVLDVHHLIACCSDGEDELIELQVDRLGVAILRVLNEKDHQERHDRRACVDDELPCIGIVKDWASGAPDQHNEYGCGKGPLGTEPIQRDTGKPGECAPGVSFRRMLKYFLLPMCTMGARGLKG